METTRPPSSQNVRVATRPTHMIDAYGLCVDAFGKV